MLSVIADEAAQAELHTDLDGLACEGARRMLAAALEAEVDAYLAAFAAERDEGGRRLVVRTATPASVRLPPWPERSQCAHLGSTTAASTRRPASGRGSGR